MLYCTVAALYDIVSLFNAVLLNQHLPVWLFWLLGPPWLPAPAQLLQQLLPGVAAYAPPSEALVYKEGKCICLKLPLPAPVVDRLTKDASAHQLFLSWLLGCKELMCKKGRRISLMLLPVKQSLCCEKGKRCMFGKCVYLALLPLCTALVQHRLCNLLHMAVAYSTECTHCNTCWARLPHQKCNQIWN